MTKKQITKLDAPSNLPWDPRQKRMAKKGGARNVSKFELLAPTSFEDLSRANMILPDGTEEGLEETVPIRARRHEPSRHLIDLRGVRPVATPALRRSDAGKRSPFEPEADSFRNLAPN